MRSLLVGAAVVAAMLLGASPNQYISEGRLPSVLVRPAAVPLACQEMPQLR